MTRQQGKIPCSVCKGKGLVWGWNVPGDAKQTWHNCHECQGAGSVLVPVVTNDELAAMDAGFITMDELLAGDTTELS